MADLIPLGEVNGNDSHHTVLRREKNLERKREGPVLIRKCKWMRDRESLAAVKFLLQFFQRPRVIPVLGSMRYPSVTLNYY